MKTILGMFGDAREMPVPFWQAYTILTLGLACLAGAFAINGLSVFSVAIFVALAWMAFVALMISYRLGMIRAHRDIQGQFSEARKQIREMGARPDKRGLFAERRGVEGPS